MARSDPDERLAKLKRELGWTGDAPPQAGGAKVLRDAVTARLEPAADLLTGIYRRFQDVRGTAASRVRSRPTATLLMALASGYALGRIMAVLGRTGRSRAASRSRAVEPAQAKAARGFDLDAALQAGMSVWRLIEARLDASKTGPAADRPA
jgi:hypothetical protein